MFRFLERYEFPILAVEILAGILFGSVIAFRYFAGEQQSSLLSSLPDVS